MGDIWHPLFVFLCKQELNYMRNASRVEEWWIRCTKSRPEWIITGPRGFGTWYWFQIEVEYVTDRAEEKAPGIIERKYVHEPMQTGLKVVGSRVPIGRDTFRSDVFYSQTI